MSIWWFHRNKTGKDPNKSSFLPVPLLFRFISSHRCLWLPFRCLNSTALGSWKRLQRLESRLPGSLKSSICWPPKKRGKTACKTIQATLGKTADGTRIPRIGSKKSPVLPFGNSAMYFWPWGKTLVLPQNGPILPIVIKKESKISL